MLAAQSAAQELAPEVLAMSRATRAIGETVAALSNCVCLESVTRAKVDKKGKVTEEERDALQIEVTTIGDREWFSWPGSGDTFVKDPASLVGFGLMNTGQLTTDLKTVFLGGLAPRHFRSAGAFQGRPGFEFDYSISSAFVHYTLRSLKGATPAGMRGSFWIDQASGDLLALSTEASEIPPDFDMRSARTEVTYAPMYLEDLRVVMPQTAITRVAHADGNISINRVAFSHCLALLQHQFHQFRGAFRHRTSTGSPGRAARRAADSRRSAALATARTADYGAHCRRPMYRPDHGSRGTQPRATLSSRKARRCWDAYARSNLLSARSSV